MAGTPSQAGLRQQRLTPCLRAPTPRRNVRAALVDGDLLGHAVQVHGVLEKCPGCGVISLGAQQEVDGVAIAVDRPVQVLPLAAELHAGLVHPLT